MNPPAFPPHPPRLRDYGGLINNEEIFNKFAAMKNKVLLLNYDSKWVTYCEAPTKIYTDAAVRNLKDHGFKDSQIKNVPQ